MSSFFRSPLDLSSTAGDSSPPEDFTVSREDVTDAINAGDKARQPDRNEQMLQTKGQDPHYHANMMLHSLLEEKCLTEALDHFKDKREKDQECFINDPDVKAFAKAKYQFLSRSLSSAGIFPSDYQSEAFSSSRVKYREGLEMLSKAQNGIEADQGVQDALVSELNNLLTSSSKSLGSPFINLASRSASYFRHREPQDYTNKFDTSLPLALQPYLENHTLLQHSRYQRDFTELGVLGKGGYGKVFKVQHRLDQAHYAIKKIKLNPSRVSRIQTNGKLGLDCILNELRVLARLEHPNVVRYYSGWVEYAGNDVSPTKIGEASPERKLIEADVQEESEVDFSGQDYVLGRVITQSTSNMHNDTDVVFENSGYDDLANFGKETVIYESKDELLFSEQEEGPVDSENEEDVVTSGRRRRQRRPSQATISSTKSKKSVVHSSGFGEDDEEIETVPRTADELANVTSSLFTPNHRNMSIELSGQNQSFFTSDSSDSSEPKLILHIQMSLHPFTLADFLLPIKTSEIQHHCFHISMAFHILLIILDGVEFLHKEGVVHRDLKPSNIFLTPREKTYHGCVDLGNCRDCLGAFGRNKMSHLQARIGDFGLVTSMACPNAILPTGSEKAVGTEFYRPPLHSGINNEKLDVFSLGVIAFELLYKFSTKMERHEVLRNLKQGRFPSNINLIIGDKASDVRDCLSGMLAADEKERYTCAEVRRQVMRIISSIDKS